MTFTPKAWLNLPHLDTPLDAAALTDIEQRLYDAASGADLWPAMEVWRDTDQSIPNNTLTDLAWEEGAANGPLAATYWTLSAPGLITFQVPGMYSVALSLDFASNSTGYRFASIRKNGFDGNQAAGSSTQNAVNGDRTRLHIASHLKIQTVGLQVKVQVLQNSGGALAVTSAFDGTSFSPTLMVARIGPAYDRLI